jgi:hypothetical protein
VCVCVCCGEEVVSWGKSEWDTGRWLDSSSVGPARRLTSLSIVLKRQDRELRDPEHDGVAAGSDAHERRRGLVVRGDKWTNTLWCERARQAGAGRGSHEVLLDLVGELTPIQMPTLPSPTLPYR